MKYIINCFVLSIILLIALNIVGLNIRTIETKTPEWKEMNINDTDVQSFGLQIASTGIGHYNEKHPDSKYLVEDVEKVEVKAPDNYPTNYRVTFTATPIQEDGYIDDSKHGESKFQVTYFMGGGELPNIYTIYKLSNKATI
uniref:Secreted protein n=1 Tax=Strongyloides venezuelensis TaxID=75913 RepID=A0A0K0FTH8_STRVS